MIETIINNPSPELIKEKRHEVGLTQSQAAKLVHRTRGNWQQWEAGTRQIDLAAWELFNLKIDLLKKEVL
jgi:putative transcriptional regulator